MNIKLPYLLIPVFIILIALSSFIYFGLSRTEGDPAEEKYQRSTLGGPFALPSYYLNDEIATTSPTLVTAGASTTLYAKIDSADHIDLFIMASSSTAAPIVNWTEEFSGQNCFPTTTSEQYSISTCDIMYFGEDGNTLTTNETTTHGVGTIVHTWSALVAVDGSESTIPAKNWSITPVASKWMRIEIGVDQVTDIWAQVIIREPTR